MQKERIHKYYNTVTVEDLLIAYNYDNIMQLPRLTHATLNTTSKKYLSDKRVAIYTFAACFLLTGQKSIPSRAHNSIAVFNLREGNLIGCKVTVRRKKMYNLIDKLLTIVLPRLQDSWRKDPPALKTDNKSAATVFQSFLGGACVGTRKDVVTPIFKRKKVAYIGINNFLLFPEVETFFSLFGSVGELYSGNSLGGFDLICHFHIPKIRIT